MNDESKYGPQTAEVEALFERARTLTDTEVRVLVEAWSEALVAAWDAAWDAAWSEALVAAWDAVWDAARSEALVAVWDAVWDAARGTARDAVWDAALALVARDLIAPDGFTQEQYDLLTGPWRRVIGAVHPDDATVLA